MTETSKRNLAKVVTYRVLAIVATVPLTGLSVALAIHVMLMILHYAHERVWARVSWGMMHPR